MPYTKKTQGLLQRVLVGNTRMRKKILSIAVPSSLNFLLNITNITIAVLYIGQLGRENIVALGMGTSYVAICYIAISSIFYFGTNAQISRLFGAKDYPAMNECLSTLFYACILVCIPTLFLAFYGVDAFISWMGLSEASATLTREFLHISIYLVPFYLLKGVLVSGFTATGNTKTPFYIKIYMTVINLALGYVLILGVPGVFNALGIKGAAYTNVIIGAGELACLLAILLGNRFMLHLRLAFKWMYFKRAIVIGVPTGAESVFNFLAVLLTSKFLVGFGDSVLAGAQIGGKIEGFCFMPAFGLMATSMSLVGQSIGSGGLWRARVYVREILTLSGAIMGVVTIAMLCFAGELAWVFSKDASVIHAATIYLYIVAISQIPQAFLFILDGAIRGAGKTMYSLVINSGCMWLFRILPMYLLLIHGFGYEVIFACMAFEVYVGLFIFYIVYRSGIWSKNLAFA